MIRPKYLAAILACLLLFGKAAAQEYSIRANRGLNLRAAPSLSADIADTVRSGSILQVVGLFNRWLKINRYGNEVWLANWVNYSRLDSSEPSKSQQPTAPIDNCCFVNRPCATNQEWVAGWYAFQRNECPASRPVALVSAPVSALAGQPINNCCFVNRQCAADEEWVAGYIAFQFDRTCQRKPPAPAHAITLSGPVPRIEGSSRFVQHIQATLRWMKRLAPEWYNYVITGMDLIFEVPTTPQDESRGVTCKATAFDRERKVRLESCWIDAHARHHGFSDADQIQTAAALGHEACHIHTHEAGNRFSSQAREEEECNKYGTGAAVLLASDLETNLDPNLGSYTFDRERVTGEIRRYCSEGPRPDLFCPTLRRLQGG